MKLTKNDVIKAIKKNFKINDNLEEYGSLIKDSNICWYYKKDDIMLSAHNALMLCWAKSFIDGGTTIENIPGKNSIMGYNCRYIAICKNFNTGKNLLIRNGIDKNRFDLGLVEIDKVKIDNEEYYIIWD